MSNGADNADGALPVRNKNYDVENKEPEPPSQTASANFPDDYSDVASQQSQSERRKHRRGGRKKKGKPQATGESRIPWSERNGRLQPGSEGHVAPQKEQNGHEQDDYGVPVEVAEEGSSRNGKPKGKQASTNENGNSEAFETGIRAFNLKRAESSGGRPFGISVDRPKSKSKPKKQKKQKKKKSKKQSDSSEDEESEEESEDDSEKRKPLSIRLDLNLELEIFLRAKVKGDITITFL
jgi:hypothetical protein